jgi:hypothetical protein
VTFILKDIRDHLVGSTAIVDAFSDRMFTENAPQGAGYPRLHLNDVSSDPEMYLGGEAGEHTTVVQIDVWTDGSGGKARANELGEMVRNRLSGYRGQFGTGVYGTARMIRNNSVAAPPIPGSDQHRRRYSMDFEVRHSASVPTFT